MKKFIPEPTKPIEPRKSIEKQIRSDIVEVGGLRKLLAFYDKPDLQTT